VSVGQLLGLFAKGLQSAELWFLLSLVALEMGTTFAIQRQLLLRMSDERRAQFWNQASWGAAILVCPMPSATMLPFFWVTRPRRGFGPGVVAILIGLASSAGLVVALDLVGQLWMWLVGLQIDGIWLLPVSSFLPR